METDRVPPPARADTAGVSFWGDLKTRWSGTLADVLVLAGSRVVGQALAAASFPLLAGRVWILLRKDHGQFVSALYTPRDYGAWMAFHSLALILAVVANWRLAVTDVSLSFTIVCFQIGAALAVGMLAAAICLRDGRLIRESIAAP